MVGTEEDINTFGWDTIFAIRIPDANKAIVDHKTSPQSFLYQDDAGKVSCQGTFGDWQICQGGDGSNIRMALPVTNIQGTYMSQGETIPFTYASLIAIMQIKLTFVPHSDQPAQHNLVVRHATDDPAEPVASLIQINWQSSPAHPGLATYVIEGALTNWCNASLDQFGHVFATVNLNNYIDNGQWAFCAPSYVDYAYVDGQTLDDSILGVLCMTNGRTGQNNARQLDPLLIPAMSRAGFAISQSSFLHDLVLPTLPLQWPHATVDNFEVTDTDGYLQLLNGRSIQLPDVQHNGISYTPYLKQFQLQVKGQTVQITSYTEIELSPGITGWCQATHTYTITQGQNQNGQTLVYQQYLDPVENHGIQQDQGIEITEIIIGILAAIALAILSVLTAGAAFIVASIIVGLLFGVAAAIPQIIEVANQDTAPSLDLLAFNLTNPIRWTDSKDFQLDFAGLRSSLLLGGNPGFI